MSNKEIDKLIDRIPKENKYMVTTEEIINYIYILENKINKTIDFIDSIFTFNECDINDIKTIKEILKKGGEDK